MTENMKQYMSKTRADYGLGFARPKIENKDDFELKGHFLKKLRTNTFIDSDHEDANEHIEKVLEIVDLFHILNITIDQVILRAFPMSLTRATSRWLRNEPTCSITTWDGLKTKFQNKYCPPARTAKKMDEIKNFQQEPDKNLYQALERFKELLMKCPQQYLTEMQEVILFYNRLGIPTRQILNSRGAIPSKTDADVKIAIQEMAEYSQKWHNRTSKSRSTKTSDGLAAIQAQLNNIGREIKKVNKKSMLLKLDTNNAKDPITPQIAHSKKKGRPLRKLTTRNLVDLFKEGDKKQQLQLRRNQGDDLMPTIEEGEVIEEFKTREEDLDTRIDDYPSFCDYDKKIHIDYKMVYRWDNIVGASTNVPIFVGNFFVVTDFAVLENIDAYRDEGMGDVIIGEPFLREVGTITLYKDDKSVSDEDMMNGISHPYQKLKGFYKGGLNLGPNYIRDARMEEWLTRGHISVHEME
uniref:Retrotransposon gag domain-containing protein n=1 Tax=Tanacetum cinerariifolium TaxID=118510 RepID=A0A6L2P5N6_TANCI|nr:hypothetical protein [Tanacetum cinerariifolium]